MSELLSSILLQQIRELDGPLEDEDLSDKDYAEMRGVVGVVTQTLIESRLGLTEFDLGSLEEAMHAHHRDAIANLFDDHYTRLLLKNVPKYVRRTLKLVPLTVKNVPSNEVRIYLEEAGRSYIFGHWRSAIALAERL